MLIFQFSLYPTHHHLHARGVFNSFFFIITLNLTTITLRPVKRENQLNSHFLLHRLPFYASFFLSLFIHHLVGSVLGHFFLGAFDCITFFVPSAVCMYIWLSHSHHHSSRFINLQPFAAHSMESKEMRGTRKRIGTGNESRLPLRQ